MDSLACFMPRDRSWAQIPNESWTLENAAWLSSAYLSSLMTWIPFAISANFFKRSWICWSVRPLEKLI